MVAHTPKWRCEDYILPTSTGIDKSTFEKAFRYRIALARFRRFNPFPDDKF